MLKRIFESACDSLQTLILVQLLFAAVVAVTVVVTFATLSAWRIIQMAWTYIFCRPF